MFDLLGYLGCGVAAGLFGGYLGVGGGIIMVPYLTLVMQLDIKVAVPISMAAIVMNSLASSSEYIRKQMVDPGLAVTLGMATILGTTFGSLLLPVAPGELVRILLSGILLYTAATFVRTKSIDQRDGAAFIEPGLMWWLVTFAGGILAGLVGIGGGIIVIPIMVLALQVPQTLARGTSTIIVGLSGVASVVVYLMTGQLQTAAIAPLLVGIIVGGKLGGQLGTVAKPKVVRILFAVVMTYVAARMLWQM